MPDSLYLTYTPNKSLSARYRCEKNHFVTQEWLPERKTFHFCDDPKLPWLQTLLSKEKMEQQLGKKILSIKPLSYQSYSQATFEFVFTDETWIGKTNRKKDPAKVFQLCQNLPIKAPKAVHFLDSPPIVFFEKVSGKLLDIQEEDRLVDVAKIMKSLHEKKEGRVDLSFLIKKIIKNVQLLKHLFPEFKESIIDQQLIEKLKCIKPIATTVHGDFHRGNLLVDDKTLYLIDLEELAISDPRIDLGRFLASMRAPYLRSGKSFEKAKEAFLKTYYLPDWEIFEAASLLTSAVSSFRFQRKGWRDEAGKLFLLAGETSIK